MNALAIMLSVVAILISAGTLYYTRAQKMVGARSAVASEDSADSAQRSAVASEESARAARDVVRIELDRRHDDLRPSPPSEVEATVDGEGQFRTLFGTITVPRDYRVRGEAVLGHNSGVSHLGLPLVLRANRTYRFQIENWPDSRRIPTAKELRFRFWPPVKVDPVEHWTCECGKVVLDGGGTGPGHWEWTVPVLVRQGSEPLP